MDRQVFFNTIRPALFALPSRKSGRLTESQVVGIEEVLDAWDKYGSGFRPHLAYILATTHHETGRRMVPVREGFALSDGAARNAVAKLKASGRIKHNYALPVDGVSYYGRGRVQNTHHANYVKLQQRFGHPFVKQPDLLLDPKIDAVVTIVGHLEGLWTNKKLSDYVNLKKLDYKGARRVVNGQDKADLIAGYAVKYDEALALAGMPLTATTKPVAPVVKKEQPTVTAKATTLRVKKPWWQSVGVLGGAGAIIAPIVGTMLGVTVTAEDTEQIIQLGTATVTAVSGLLAIIGRVRASKKIG